MLYNKSKKEHDFYSIRPFCCRFSFSQRTPYVNKYYQDIEREFIAIIILFISAEQCFAQNSLFKMKNLKLPSQLGIITYGLYCLHFIGILITINITRMLGINTHLWQVIVIDMPLSLMISIFIAKCSYTLYEKPFLKLKERFSYFSK